MKLLKILSVLLILSFCYIPETNAQSWKELKKSLKEAKEALKGKKNDTSENSENSQEPSNPNDEITLTVSADGTSKEEATKIALRSAIEQAYGTFVSANTTILNDDMVKDEIVTISNGNIKRYKELSFNELPNGKMYVTLETTVCISKLVSYAQSKGAETEFAGASFGINMKMKELNKKNEETALQNMAKQVNEMFPYAFEYELEIKDPTLINTNGGWATNLIDKSSDISEALQYMGIKESLDNFYYSEFIIKIKPTEQYKSILHLIFNTFTSLALSNEEQKEYKKLNIPIYPTKIFDFTHSIYNFSMNHLTNKFIELGLGTDVALRSDFKEFIFELNQNMATTLAAFTITDNTGTSSQFEEVARVWYNGSSQCLAPSKGTNLLQFSTIVGGIPEMDQRSNEIRTFKKLNFNFYNKNIKVLDFEPYAKIPVLISKKDIAKYSKFEIKNNYLK